MDGGIGIPAEKLPFIFDQFCQTQDYGKSGGLRLGLYICKSIVERHNGEIWAESDGNGSVFYVKLPVAGSTKKSMKNKKH